MPGKKTMKQAKKLGIKGTGYKAGKKIVKKQKGGIAGIYKGSPLHNVPSNIIKDINISSKDSGPARQSDIQAERELGLRLHRGPGIFAGGKVPSFNELVTAKLMKKGGKIK